MGNLDWLVGMRPFEPPCERSDAVTKCNGTVQLGTAATRSLRERPVSSAFTASECIAEEELPSTRPESRRMPSRLRIRASAIYLLLIRRSACGVAPQINCQRVPYRGAENSEQSTTIFPPE